MSDADASDRTLHQRVSALFAEFIALDDAARAASLDRLDDPAVARELRSLLAADADSDALATGAGWTAVDEDPDPLPAQIGAYTIIRRLGTGGMGTVFEARQREPDRSVALKVLRLHGGADAVRRFRNEARMLGRLSHPCIARVYESGTAETPAGIVPFLAMEFVDGITLDVWARDRATDASVRMMITIARAVEHAHVSGVIHRDLKPGNILVDHDDRPRILDFGVARAVRPELVATAIETAAGQVIGTLPYMSPEQIDGTSAAPDARTDVYALGAVLYQMLSGRLPIDVSTLSLSDAARRIADEQPPRLGHLDRRLRGDIETIVARALEKDPARRYESAGAFADDLERTVRREPIHARPPSTLYQVRRFAARNRAVVSGIIGMLLILIAGVIVSITFAMNEKAARERADEGFDGVRELVRTFVQELDESMADLPGTLEARRTLVEKTSGYLEYLDAEAGDDPAILNDVASGYITLGDIQGQPNRPNIGEREAAMESYHRGLDAAERAFRLVPNDIETRRRIAILHERIGNLEMVARDFNAALASYEASHDIKLALADDTDDGRLDLSFSLNKLSRVYSVLGRPDDALDAAERSLDSRQALLDEATDATRLDRRRQLSSGHNRVGDLLLDAGRPADALEHFATSLEIRRAIRSEHPSNARARRDLAVVAYRVALANERLERFDAAFRAHEEVIEILEWLTAAAPDDHTALLDHAGALAALGRLRAQHGDPAVARTELQASIDGFARAEDPAAAEFEIEAHLALSVLDLETRAFDPARAHALRALAIATRLTEEAPDAAIHFRLRARAQHALGTIARAADDRAAARRHDRAALGSYAEVAERGHVRPADAEAIAELEARHQSE